MAPEKLTFSPLSHRQIEADFSGGYITSDARLLLLREVDKQHHLTQRLTSVLSDPRIPKLVRYKLETMTRSSQVTFRPTHSSLRKNRLRPSEKCDFLTLATDNLAYCYTGEMSSIYLGYADWKLWFGIKPCSAKHTVLTVAPSAALSNCQSASQLKLAHSLRKHRCSPRTRH